MIIYLSGPMSGIPEHNFPEFHRVASKLREDGHTVISPAEIDQPIKEWNNCMRRDIAAMMRADTIALLHGWQRSRGAGIEISIAAGVGMGIVDAETLLPIALDVDVSIKEMIEAGDTVHHKPSDETWKVIGVNHERGELCVAGWPATIAKIADCELVEKGDGITEEELTWRDRTFGGGWES